MLACLEHPARREELYLEAVHKSRAFAESKATQNLLHVGLSLYAGDQ